jgi:hypothetical protein
MTIAVFILLAVLLYMACGVLVGVPFVLAGVQRIDPAAHDAPIGFRLLILPGCVALWPFVLRRWVGAARGEL